MFLFPNVVTTDARQIFLSSCNLLHNNIVRQMQANSKELSPDLFFKQCFLALKMYQKILPLKTVLETKYIHYFRCLISYDIPIEKCYTTVLEAITSATKENTNDLLVLLCPVLRLKAKYLLNNNRSSELKSILQTTSEILSQQNIHKNELVEVLKNIKHQVCDNKCPPDIQIEKMLLPNIRILKRSFQCKQSTRATQEICLLLSTISDYLIKYFITSDEEVLKNILDDKNQLVLLKYLGLLSRIISQMEVQCNNCFECCVKTDILSAIETSLLASTLLKNLLSKDLQPKNDIFKAVYTHLEQCCVFVTYMKNKKCSQWENAWVNTGVTLYNLSVNLYKIFDDHCDIFYTLFLKNLINLEGVNDSMIKPNIFNLTFPCFIEFYIKKQNFQRALLISGIFVYLCTTEKYDSLTLWVRVKMIHKGAIKNEENLQHETIVSILKKNSDYVKTFDKVFNLSNEVAVELLTSELNQYKKIWPSKIPMMSAIKALSNIADSFTFSKILTNIFLNKTIQVHEDVSDIIFNTISGIEQELRPNDNTTEKHIYLACLKLIYYEFQTDIVRRKMKDDMSKVGCFSLEGKNSNDVCDLVTCYDQLNLETHLKNIKLIDDALEIFENFVCCKSIGEYEFLNEINLYQVLTKISHEYRLQCFTFNCLKTWFLSLKVAKILKSPYYILESIGFILELSNADTKDVNDLIEYSQKIINEISSFENRDENLLESVCGYYINKSIFYYKNNNIENGINMCKLAEKYVQKLEESEKKLILETRLDYVNCLYLMSPCSFKVDGHDKFFYKKLYSAVKRICELSKSSGNFFFRCKIISLIKILYFRE